LGPPLSRPEKSPLAAGACVDLPIEIADKYFMANAVTERFQFMTAKAICGRCAVQAVCLAEAMEQPPVEAGVRGGESVRGILKLRYRHLRGEASAEVLAAKAIAAQQPLGGLRTAATLLAGRFEDVPLVSLQPVVQRRIG
jgi:hypothetical protein